MSLPILPNPSNFLGVALVINRSRDGPRFVFHYPANVLPVDPRAGPEQDDEDEFAERETRPAGLGNTGGSIPNPSELAQWNRDDHLFTESGSQIVPWEHVAGFPTKALEAILTPARAYHKTLFQVSLDPIYCVSYPIYAPENGIWKKKKKQQQQQQKDQKSSAKASVPRKSGGAEDEAAGQESGDALFQTPDQARPSDAKGIDVKDMAGKVAADEPEDKISSMTMFNLVFILNPKKHEVKDLVDTMYAHIIKKVNKAYKYCQQRNGFVWKESKKILALKDKAREDRAKMSSLWNEILATSSLAASMQDVYDAISQNKIATLQLDMPEGTIAHSVQIPFPFHVSDLPGEDEEAARGMWLTTANSFVNNDDAADETGYLDKNFALLLVDDEKKIVSELQADPDETTMAMVEFVKHSKPTLSFYQVAQQPNNILTLGQVRKYAQHFIVWRRAMAIPPLHARDVYMLSPNCDLARLPRATAEWRRTFPLAPPLPDFLAVLSTAPRPYKSICPAKSYRPDYLRMLAWLMRDGWVTQLCTFAYVVVWPEILYEVEYQLEADELAKAKRVQRAAADELETKTGRHVDDDDDDDEEEEEGGTPSASIATLKGSARPQPVGSLDDDSSLSASHPSSSSTLSSPTKDFGSSSREPHHHHRQPTPAERAAEKARLERMAEKAARELAEKATAHGRKAVPTQTEHPSVNDAPHLAHMTGYIILDARKPTGKESLYLMAIGKRLRERRSQPPASSKKAADPAKMAAGSRGPGGGPRETKSWDDRVADTWPIFWKYFNGRSALERIALQEEMKRKDVWNLLTAMSEYLLCLRHW